MARYRAGAARADGRCIDRQFRTYVGVGAVRSVEPPRLRPCESAAGWGCVRAGVAPDRSGVSWRGTAPATGCRPAHGLPDEPARRLLPALASVWLHACG